MILSLEWIFTAGVVLELHCQAICPDDWLTGRIHHQDRLDGEDVARFHDVRYIIH